MADLTLKAVFQGQDQSLSSTAQTAKKNVKDLNDTVAQGNGQAGATIASQQQVAKAAVATAAAHDKLTNSYKLNSFQVKELTYAGRHLWEQLGSNVSATTIFTTQVGHLSAAFTDADQVGGLLATVFSSVWTYAALAAASVAAATLAVSDFEASRRGLANATAAAGNPFQLSDDDVEHYAQTLRKGVMVTQSEARDIVAAFENNNVAPQFYSDLTRAAQGFSDSTGAKMADALALMGGAMKDPAKGADDLKSKLNLLSGQQVEHIAEVQRTEGVYAAQDVLTKILVGRYGDLANKIGAVSLGFRGIVTAVEDIPNLLAQPLDALVPGKRDTGASTNNTNANQVHDLMTQYGAYNLQVQAIRDNIAFLTNETNDASLSDQAHKEVVTALAGAHIQLSLAEKAHADQLRSLNPVEQAHFEMVKSLVGGAQQAVAQAQAQITADARLAEAATGTAIAQQDAADAAERHAKLLPYLTAEAYATSAQLDILHKTEDDLMHSMAQDQVYKNFIKTVADIRTGLQSLGDNAPVAAMDDALAMNAKTIRDWHDLSIQNLKDVGSYTGDYQRYVEDIFQNKLATLYEDDLRRRKDWGSGIARANLDINRSNADLATQSEKYVHDWDQAGEDGFVGFVTNAKNQLSNLESFVEEMIARMVYQRYLASSFNALGGGILDVIGGALGGGGGYNASAFGAIDTSFMSVPVAHGGWDVDAGGPPGWRVVSADMFSNAAIHHTGRSGLAANEQPVIVERSEDILTARQQNTVGDALDMAGRGGTPKINFQLINRTSTAATASQGNTTTGADGSLTIEVLIDAVDRGLTKKQMTGNSNFGNLFAGQHGLQKKTGS